MKIEKLLAYTELNINGYKCRSMHYKPEDLAFINLCQHFRIVYLMLNTLD